MHYSLLYIHVGPSKRGASNDNYESDFEDTEEVIDLNKASTNVLLQKKEEMDILFEANRVTPGDKDWVYDKVVDFGEGDKLSCGWDDESENSDIVI